MYGKIHSSPASIIVNQFVASLREGIPRESGDSLSKNFTATQEVAHTTHRGAGYCVVLRFRFCFVSAMQAGPIIGTAVGVVLFVAPKFGGS